MHRSVTGHMLRLPPAAEKMRGLLSLPRSHPKPKKNSDRFSLPHVPYLWSSISLHFQAGAALMLAVLLKAHSAGLSGFAVRELSNTPRPDKIGCIHHSHRKDRRTMDIPEAHKMKTKDNVISDKLNHIRNHHCEGQVTAHNSKPGAIDKQS
ncbi:hypothetical protein PROFUN_07101 [Planoprotostelium fungivorum]|uniref:Uncharacterized protein n=1 Tax=Planoprotostelium fungivorum TaxID=1890364 RepID=A0A2P6NMG1_9EUKA|nr:hypothetical protein PROFUN_07101 [Planoprotostelium fungivorum]